MNNLYIVVEKDNDGREINLITRNDEYAVIHYIGVLSATPRTTNNREVLRVFSIDSFGRTNHYNIVFADGRFKLDPIPEVRGGN